MEGHCIWWQRGFPGDSDGKESACSVGNPGLIPGLGRSPEEGNGYPLQYSCLRESLDRGAWLPSMGLQRVRHNWATNSFTSAFPGGTSCKEPACEFIKKERITGPIPGSARSLQASMATYPRVFAWKLPWTEEPGRMQPRRLQTRSTAEAVQHRHTQRSLPQTVSDFTGNQSIFRAAASNCTSTSRIRVLLSTSSPMLCIFWLLIFISITRVNDISLLL